MCKLINTYSTRIKVEIYGVGAFPVTLARPVDRVTPARSQIFMLEVKYSNKWQHKNYGHWAWKMYAIADPKFYILIKRIDGACLILTKIIEERKLCGIIRHEAISSVDSRNIFISQHRDLESWQASSPCTRLSSLSSYDLPQTLILQETNSQNGNFESILNKIVSDYFRQ
jgi:hypothetical protein